MQNGIGYATDPTAYELLRSFLRERGVTPSAQTQACNLLNRLKWPGASSDIPVLGNSGALLFHPTAGIVCRIQLQAQIIEHPLVLPRLRTFRLDDECSLELCIGGNINPSPSSYEAKWIDRNLIKDGIAWLDCENYNACRLPLPTREFPDGLPAIMDREAIILITRTRGLQRRDYTDFGVPEIQSRIFREQINSLRRLLARACLKDSMNPDSTMMDDFWQTAEALTTPITAAKATAEKPLFQGWGNPSNSMLDSPKAQLAQYAFNTLSPLPRRPSIQRPSGPAPAPTAHHRPH